jgi:redox-sensitive bicupin YhaK (pirin superfamily)
MAKNRKIKMIVKSVPTIEGAGVHLKRAFGFRETRAFDPFLLLDDFRATNPKHFLKGFPWHPHRGIETITYMLEGLVEHGDSMGNKGVIHPGEVQWMTAGSGIIHQEMPQGDDQGHMGGFQLWANLPASHKMMDPRYREVKSEQIPVVTTGGGAKVRVISGQINSTRGPVQDVVTDPTYLDISIPPETELVHATIPGHTVIAYVIEGKGWFCQQKDPFSYEVEGRNYFDLERDPFVTNEELILFDDGEQIVASTTDEPVRFLLMSGKPLREPVAWYGPIVMNTQAELQVAFEELNHDTFIKHK